MASAKSSNKVLQIWPCGKVWSTSLNWWLPKSSCNRFVCSTFHARHGKSLLKNHCAYYGRNCSHLTNEVLQPALSLQFMSGGEKDTVPNLELQWGVIMYAKWLCILSYFYEKSEFLCFSFLLHFVLRCIFSLSLEWVIQKEPILWYKPWCTCWDIWTMKMP